MSIEAQGLLLRFRGGAGPGAAGLRAAGGALHEVISAPKNGVGLAAGETWYRADLAAAALGGVNGWDAAHEVLRSGGAALGLAGGPDFVEPDFLQQWLDPRRTRDGAPLVAANGEVCSFDDQDRDLPRRPDFAWHLGVSELRAARTAVRNGAPVRIAHLDTGYDPAHHVFRDTVIERGLGHNFTGQGASNDPTDPEVSGFMKTPGHGTGTLGILAGGAFSWTANGYAFNEAVGGAPMAKIVPLRVANGVVQLKTSAVAEAFNHVVKLCEDDDGSGDRRVHVVSMSMGGVASGAWARAVNRAYEAGVVLVTATGNNFSVGLAAFPARSIVYPARFRRVIAACGVMADGSPYFGLSIGTMQGNWGPASKMRTAVAAYTPNTSWAQLGCPGIVDMNGAGTSSATPQVAAAAALYIRRHAARLAQYSRPWMRVEAVRRALFESADADADSGDLKKLGRGALRAMRALEIAPPPESELEQTEEATASFAFLRVLTGIGAAASPADEMFALEATQLVHRWPDTGDRNGLEAAAADPDEGVTEAERRTFLERVESHPDASEALRRWVRGRLDAESPGRNRDAPAAPARPDPVEPAAYPTPAYRALRAYALDPSLSTALDTVAVSEVELRVPWEPLKPGPVGEYLEVIDIDPPSGCGYAPVNLEDAALLAQRGLPPSEGTPQFHQQMVYAVASLTIGHFERALGRRALWRPLDQPGPDGSRFVEKLRVHPHALREANAYYSPQKRALLFGYFGAGAGDAGSHMAGSRVFTCLSHDIVAHETTHALLDGMHQRFLVASNPDVRAFHEAFADIVALFQHFTLPEMLRHAIASTRGKIRTRQSLLGTLAVQFGRTTGRRAGLREAIGRVDENGEWKPHEAKPEEYQRATSPHERGAYLVAAVFDAFMSIYEHRVADLVRLASGGTGELAPGAIHPDLVGRLADEAAKSAGHVLTMCIRALDYCPPTDITFGEYLRAVLTADADLVPNDDRRYRVAFAEAFRKRGIYPRNVPTLSVESLLWGKPETEQPPPSAVLTAGLARLRDYAAKFVYARTRREVFDLQGSLATEVKHWLQAAIVPDAAGREDAKFLGLDADRDFEVHTARIAVRNAPNGDVVPRLIIGLLQEERDVPIDPTGRRTRERTAFEGGSTVIADLSEPRFAYCIRKSMTSGSRLERQRAFALDRLGSARATYASMDEDREPFALLHRGL